MERIAVFPGSFDPFTAGHESLIIRGLDLFDKIIIAVGVNSEKRGFLPVEKRVELIESVFKNNPRVEVKTYSNLTVDFCKQNNAVCILRGLRTSADFEYERAIAQVNKVMRPDIETYFLLTLPEFGGISSTLVREVVLYKGDARKFLPQGLDFEYFFGYQPK